MKRKSIRLILGLAVISGLAGSYFYLKSYNEKAEEAELEEAAGEEILTVDSADLKKISFYIGETEETFYLDGETWKLESDESFPVNESLLLAPITQMNPLQAVRRLENAESITEYGLDEPQNVITMTDTEDQVIVAAIGDTNSGTGNDYLMLNGEETVIYTVEEGLRTAFYEDLYDYAYSEEMPVLMTSEIVAVSVDSENSGYELYLEDAKWTVCEVQRQQGNDGNISEAEEVTADVENGWLADSDAVNDAMSSLGSLAYADYLEHNCPAPAEYGIDDVSERITIWYQAEAEVEEGSEAETENETEAENETKDRTETESEGETETEPLKEEKSVSFRIGDTDSAGNYYVQMEGSTEVHTLSYTVLEKFLGKTVEDWISE